VLTFEHIQLREARRAVCRTRVYPKNSPIVRTRFWPTRCKTRGRAPCEPLQPSREDRSFCLGAGQGVPRGGPSHARSGFGQQPAVRDVVKPHLLRHSVLPPISKTGRCGTGSLDGRLLVRVEMAFLVLLPPGPRGLGRFELQPFLIANATSLRHTNTRLLPRAQPVVTIAPAARLATRTRSGRVFRCFCDQFTQLDSVLDPL
jgi:hypothetical protein